MFDGRSPTLVWCDRSAPQTQGRGNTSSASARAAALGPNGSMFLAGNTGGAVDAVVFHLDSNGDYIWDWEWEVSGTFT